MKNPAHYKTAFGLYKATIRALETLDGCARGWFILNAIEHAKNGMKDDILVQQLRKLSDVKRSIKDLEIIRI